VVTVTVLGPVIRLEGVVVVGEVVGVTGISVEEVDGVAVMVAKGVEVSVEEVEEVSMGEGAGVVELVVIVGGKGVREVVDDVVVDGGGGSGVETVVVGGGIEDGGRDNTGDDSVGLDRLQHQIKHTYIYNIQRTRRCCKIGSALSIFFGRTYTQLAIFANERIIMCAYHNRLCIMSSHLSRGHTIPH